MVVNATTRDRDFDAAPPDRTDYLEWLKLWNQDPDIAINTIKNHSDGDVMAYYGDVRKPEYYKDTLKVLRSIGHSAIKKEWYTSVTTDKDRKFNDTFYGIIEGKEGLVAVRGRNYILPQETASGLAIAGLGIAAYTLSSADKLFKDISERALNHPDGFKTNKDGRIVENFHFGELQKARRAVLQAQAGLSAQ